MKNVFTTAILTFTFLLSAAGHGQTVKEVLSFSDALSSSGGAVTLAQGRDGRLYGTTDGFSSTTNPDGTIFRVNPDGSAATTLFSLSGTNGQEPAFGLTLAIDGNYYGTTVAGGVASSGVLFKVSPTGTYTVLYQFTGGSDGALPVGPPIQASDGNFYGATNHGTVYKYVPSTATFSTILTLSSDGSQGVGIDSPLIQASNGSLYGTAVIGGTSNCGTLFRLSTTGVLIHVYSFPCKLGGKYPQAPLYEASDGNLYGTTVQGGTAGHGCGTVGCGTIFRVSQGVVSVIYRFSGYPNDGALPASGLVQGTDGNLYGSTEQGGVSKFGTLYQITTSGQYKLLYSFADAIGIFPGASLMQHTNGKFYGTASAGGTNSYGSIYSLDMGLGPFISLVHYTGSVGHSVQILGQGLLGSTAVTVNGLAATSFKVVSDYYMTAVVPTGATTGPVVVTTPTGTLTSNQNFRIVQ
jgi:uncharacterized repeat protein (TIGR03803 family)